MWPGLSISRSPVRRGGARPIRSRTTTTREEIVMGKFVFAYTGGSMSSTPEEQEAAMKAWGGWFETLGSAVVDLGAPFGTSTAVKGDAPKAALSGYSVIEAA